MDLLRQQKGATDAGMTSTLAPGSSPAPAAPKSAADAAKVAEESAPGSGAAASFSSPSACGPHGKHEDSTGVPAVFAQQKPRLFTLAPKMLLAGEPKSPPKRKLPPPKRPKCDAGTGAEAASVSKMPSPSAPIVPPPPPVLPGPAHQKPDGPASKAALPPGHFVPGEKPLKTGWMSKVVLLAALQESGQHEWMQKLLKQYSGHKDVAAELKKLLGAIQEQGLVEGIHKMKYHKLLD